MDVTAVTRGMAPRVADGRRGKRHHSHQLGRPRRAYGSSPPGPMPWVAGPRRHPGGLRERSWVPQGRENPLAIETRGGGRHILGVHPSPDVVDVHSLVLRDSPLRLGDLVGRGVASLIRAGRRHGGIGGPKAFPILPRSVSRNTAGRAESAESAVMIAMGPPRRDRHQRRDRYFLDTKRKIR